MSKKVLKSEKKGNLIDLAVNFNISTNGLANTIRTAMNFLCAAVGEKIFLEAMEEIMKDVLEDAGRIKADHIKKFTDSLAEDD